MQQLMDQLTCSLYGVRGFQMDVRESQMVSGSLRWCQRISDLESFIGRYSLLRLDIDIYSYLRINWKICLS